MHVCTPSTLIALATMLGAQIPKQPSAATEGALTGLLDSKAADHDVKSFADAAAEIKKLNDHLIEDYKTRLKANGKDPLGPGNAGVVQMYLDESKKWRTTAELAKFNLDRGKIREAVFSLKPVASAMGSDYIRSLALTQRGKNPSPLDSDYAKNLIAKVRVAGRLLGWRIPDPITPEWLAKQGGF